MTSGKSIPLFLALLAASSGLSCEKKSKSDDGKERKVIHARNSDDGTGVDGEPASKETPLSGVIDGVAWTFGKGIAYYAYENQADRPDTLNVTLSSSIDPKRDYYDCDEDGGVANIVVGDDAFATEEAEARDLGVSFYLPDGEDEVEFRSETAHEGLVNPPDELYFSLESYSLVADSGRLEITERSATKIKGYIEGFMDREKEYEVRGTFEVKICD